MLVAVYFLLLLPSALVDTVKFKLFPARSKLSAASLSHSSSLSPFTVPEDLGTRTLSSSNSILERAVVSNATCAPPVTVTVTVPRYISVAASSPNASADATASLPGGANETWSAPFNGSLPVTIQATSTGWNTTKPSSSVPTATSTAYFTTLGNSTTDLPWLNWTISWSD